MITVPTPLGNHIATRCTSLATALKITRKDNAVFAFTSHDVDDPISGVTYKSKPGLSVTSIDIASGAVVGNLELTTLHDGTIFTTVDVFNGLWRNADFIVFRYNWASILDGIVTLLVGTIGECGLRQNTLVAELRDLRQYFQQPVGDASSKTCRARLGDTRCTKDLTSFTYTGTLTAVTDNQTFRDSSRAEALAWFDEGEITFNTGANAGVSAKIKSHLADGTFTLALPLWGTVVVGDTYTVIAGCRKRLAEDCATKFNNVLNFVGEPHRPGIDTLTAAPVVGV